VCVCVCVCAYVSFCVCLFAKKVKKTTYQKLMKLDRNMCYSVPLNWLDFHII